MSPIAAIPPFFAKPLRHVFGAVFALTSPARCRLCRRTLFNHSNQILCHDCVAALGWIDRACRRCGYPSGPYAGEQDGCSHCRSLDLRLTAAAGVVRYRDGARSMVLSLKFRGEIRIATTMAELMAHRFSQAELKQPDLVAPVPLHPNRLRQRGFDQAALLAEQVAGKIGVECRPRLLHKGRDTAPQSTLNKKERAGNMVEAFSATPEADNKSILLIDDVMTSGATMADCARACRQAGAKRVTALVFAR
ncbi:MAG: ComF family protein [Planctomycetes bacterium]|nr:ComF family protein [Planctomycetota bacterium]